MEWLGKENMLVIQIAWWVAGANGCLFSSILLSRLQTIRNLSLMPLMFSLIKMK